MRVTLEILDAPDVGCGAFCYVDVCVPASTAGFVINISPPCGMGGTVVGAILTQVDVCASPSCATTVGTIGWAGNCMGYPSSTGPFTGGCICPTINASFTGPNFMVIN